MSESKSPPKTSSGVGQTALVSIILDKLNKGKTDVFAWICNVLVVHS